VSGFFDDVRVRSRQRSRIHTSRRVGRLVIDRSRHSDDQFVATNVRSLVSAAEIANDGATGRQFRQVVPNIIGGQPYTVSGWIKSNLSGGQA
jgi:hypothetical protein